MEVILADDLTGACDVAAAMGRDVWVPVDRSRMRHAAGILVYNTESRGMPATDARTEVARALSRLPGPILYWKIDSLLRGNWAYELAEAVSRGAIERMLVAPAFPEQDRATIGGIQYAHGVPRASIAAHLLAAGVAAERFRVVDAGTADELRRAAETLRPGETPVGSAGLARAIWKPRRVYPVRVGGPVLVVVGTASPRGRAQIEALRPMHGVRVIEPNEQPSLIRSIRQALAECNPAALVVVGGETLSAVTALISAAGLLVKGEVAAGVALAQIAGGPLDSLQIITKAGDFGGADTLADAAAGIL